MEIIRSLHAVAGIVLILAGLVQIVFPKGGLRHAMTGLTYLAAWLVIMVSTVIVGNYLNSSMAILGFYLAFSGWRFASRRRTTHKTADKAAVAVALICGLGTIAVSIHFYLVKDKGVIVGMLIGLAYMALAGHDLIKYVLTKKKKKKDPSKSLWYFQHIQRMYASFIIALVSFGVIQDIFHNNLFNWLIPLSGGLILLFVSLWYFRKKLDKEKKKA
jgi:hypothetical protein